MEMEKYLTQIMEAYADSRASENAMSWQDNEADWSWEEDIQIEDELDYIRW